MDASDELQRLDDDLASGRLDATTYRRRRDELTARRREEEAAARAPAREAPASIAEGATPDRGAADPAVSTVTGGPGPDPAGSAGPPRLSAASIAPSGAACGP